MINEVLSIALRGTDSDWLTVRPQLDQLGHMTVFHRQPEKPNEISQAEECADLLIAMYDENFNWREFLALCKSSVLLIVKDSAWDSLRNEIVNFPIENRPIDFVAWSALGVELSPRIRALTHRAWFEDLVWDDYHFSARSRTLFHYGKRIHLKPREYDLALLIFRHIGTVVERKMIAKMLWPSTPNIASSRAIDTCVCMLRKKLQLQGDNGLLLRSIYRTGYQLVATR